MVTVLLFTLAYVLVAAAFVAAVRDCSVDGFEDAQKGFVVIPVSTGAGAQGDRPAVR
jgi:hypothetical protein